MAATRRLQKVFYLIEQYTETIEDTAGATYKAHGAPHT